MNANQMNILQRLAAPTPKFFQTIRNIGLTLGVIGGAILATPVELPALLITIASYLTTAGAIAGCIGQTAVDEEQLAAS